MAPYTTFCTVGCGHVSRTPKSCDAASRRGLPCRVGCGARAAGGCNGMGEGVGTRGGHSPRDLIMQTDDLLTWVPPSPTRVKKSSRRRAPDAERGCPPATVVARASSPSSPEAGAAPRRPSVSQPASDGSLAPNHRSVPFLQNGTWWSWQTLTVAATTGSSLRLSLIHISEPTRPY